MGWVAIFGLLGMPCYASPPPAVRTALDRYCIGCHNQKTKTAGVALDGPGEIGAQPEVWEKVVRKLRTRSMPPAGLPRPDESTYASVLTSVETELDTAAARGNSYPAP